GRFSYDTSGRLERAGETAFSYGKSGALATRADRWGVTRYQYGDDTMLDTVMLPDGGKIRYEYEPNNPLGPARRYRDGKLSAEYVWNDPLLLSALRDHEMELEYTFIRDKAGVPDRVRIAPFKPAPDTRRKTGAEWGAESVTWLRDMGLRHRREWLGALLPEDGGPVEFFCGCDQVGTLKVLTDAAGNLIKKIDYDSFGVVQHDSFPDLFLPIGFAGGLVDQDTGLVRFGYRDYDPQTGRFTAPDPLGDTGGDHDLYDYCVDDPVSMADPTGLHPIAGFFLGMMKAGVISAGGLATAGLIAEGANAVMGSKESSGKAMNGAVQGIKMVPPAVAIGSAPVLAAVPGAYTTIGRSIGAAIAASKHAGAIVRGGSALGRALDGAFVPVSPVAPSFSGMWGAIGRKIYEETK
ncbi:RHS repeat-associated core domain-containing protein, partial [Desulfovibrio sp. OttesenSCG-928-O18]|nr:RHS repeat-associated core domain-containing protein [Desulfovibrio sp. OttesenSCG-928-O18]